MPTGKLRCHERNCGYRDGSYYERPVQTINVGHPKSKSALEQHPKQDPSVAAIETWLHKKAERRSSSAPFTGFTIGHSVTLALGFFGYVPTGAWFVPAVETGIALSIIYAAYIAIRPTAGKGAGQARIFLVTMSIGFLHGLGFSFVLQEILQVTSPNIWQSLLAFNVGVELGQLLIVLAIWPVFHLLDWTRPTAGRLARAGVAAACMALAVFWTTERGIETASAFQVAAAE